MDSVSNEATEPAVTDLLELAAYRVNTEPLLVEPAGVRRDWMDQTTGKFATRCLPMMMANQAGWMILNSHPVRVTWNGGPSPDDVRVEHIGSSPEHAPVAGHFGSGIITWTLGLLFRTPPEFNLWVRGPANLPKEGIYALEGIVETDWSFAPFTMNWKLSRPNEPVTFDEGEPIAMIVPQRKDDLERFSPIISSISADPGLAAAYRAWNTDREAFIRDRAPKEYQSDYVRGRHQGEPIAKHHSTRLKLRPFRERDIIQSQDTSFRVFSLDEHLTRG